MEYYSVSVTTSLSQSKQFIVVNHIWPHFYSQLAHTFLDCPTDNFTFFLSNGKYALSSKELVSFFKHL